MRFGWLTLSPSPSPEEDAERIDQQIEQVRFAERLGLAPPPAALARRKPHWSNTDLGQGRAGPSTSQTDRLYYGRWLK
jgi:hypothetical protein